MKYANLKQTCPKCMGRGYYIPLFPIPPTPIATIVQCPTCSGKGRIVTRVKVTDDHDKERDKTIPKAEE